jgi:carotenoid cleavage dioxygenase-like enzyme
MGTSHGEMPGELFRYSLDVATGEATETRLSSGLDLDFPVIPSHMVTRTAKYCYAATNFISESMAERRNSILCALNCSTLKHVE